MNEPWAPENHTTEGNDSRGKTRQPREALPGVQLTYQTDYPNQVHQLMISVSKHLYLIKDGSVRFQKKKFDHTLANVHQSEKQHVVHYLVRDHFSGAFYAEATASSQLFPVEQFLLRAWSKKDKYIFCGMPEHLSVPNTVADAFPNILEWVDSLGVKLLNVTSGFQGGIRDLPTWEKYLQMVFNLNEKTRLSEVQEKAARISNYLNHEHGDRASKIDKWAYRVGTIRLPSGETATIHHD